MSTPKTYIRRPDPDDEPEPIEAIRFDGTRACAEVVRAWLERRYRAVSPYSSVPPPVVEYLTGQVPYLVLLQGNGKHAAVVAGEWLICEGRAFRPWVQGAYEFADYYVEHAGLAEEST